MTDVDRTLAAIDDAIGYVDADYSVGPDAMRWSHEEPERPARPRQAAPAPADSRDIPLVAGSVRAFWAPLTASLSVFDEDASAWREIGTVDADGITTPAPPEPSELFVAFRPVAVRPVIISWTASVTAVTKHAHAALVMFAYGSDGFRRHRRRCPICNPAGFPKPLASNGREYRRRTHARRRRNRR